MPLSVTQYQEKRDELVILLKNNIEVFDEIKRSYPINLESLNEARDEIKIVSNIVFENMFKIVLVAHFQGGKSTSFNSLAGGAVYSPLGDGAMKCSAAPIEAYNVENPKEIGGYLELRSDKELSELLQAALEEKFVLPHDLEKAKASWNKEIEKWRGNRGSLTDDERDALYIAGIILEHYNSGEIQNFRKLADGASGGIIRIELERAKDLVKFPPRWTVRYQDGDPSVFQASEVVFPFVKRVTMKLQSEDLRAIGASVIDCPGLFANAFDAKVTMMEMINAQAVWFLGEARALSGSEKDAIRVSLDQCGDRVFFSVNIKKAHVAKHKVIEEIFPVIRTEIRNSGVAEADNQLFPYHAQMALLAKQGKLLLEGKADESITKWLIDVVNDKGLPNHGVHQNWETLATSCLYELFKVFPPEFAALPRKLSPEGIAILERDSDWQAIVQAIQDYVVRTKGRAILIGNSKKVETLHQNLQGVLKQKEEEVAMTEEQANQKYAEAEAVLQEFNNHVEGQLEPFKGSDGKNVDKKLAEDMFEEIFDGSGIDKISSEAARQIQQSFGWTDVLPWNQQEFQQKCKRIIRKAFSGHVTTRIARWVSAVARGRNQTAQHYLFNPANRMGDNIRQHWENIAAKNAILLNIPSQNLRFAEDRLSEVIDFSDDVIEEIFNACGNIDISVFSVVWDTLKEMMGGDGSGLKSTISAALRKAVKSDRGDIVGDFRETVKPLRIKVRKRIRRPVETIREELHRRRKEALEELKRTKAERELLGKQCHEIRTRYIEPLAGDIQRFIETTEPLC